MMRIYCARQLTDTGNKYLRSSQYEVAMGAAEPPSRKELLAGARGADGAIVTLTEKIDRKFFDVAGQQLKVVANVAVGFDNIDLAEAKKRGVRITNTPGVLSGATADHTFAMILNLARHVSAAERFLWAKPTWNWGPRMMTGLDISAGTTIGIIGYGRIGRAVGKRARGFDMSVLAFHPGKAGTKDADGTPYVALDDLLANSDVVSLHVPLTPQTHYMIGAREFALMKPTAIVVNAARGGVMREDDLITALDRGEIAGAALDTFENEPHVDPRLVGRDDILVQPHIGSAGLVTRDRMCTLAVDNVFSVLAGKEPLTPVV
jgi:lactate dehydrogenase-like 2-hydroxyacid dehydrogenase